MTISASHNTNKILQVYGPNGYCSSTVTTACDSVGTGTTRNIKGQPVNGWYYVPFTYADSNSDGIIEPNEVVVGTRKADGTLDPDDPGLHGLLESARHRFDLERLRQGPTRKLRLNVLMDCKGGFGLFNNNTEFYCAARRTSATTWPLDRRIRRPVRPRRCLTRRAT